MGIPAPPHNPSDVGVPSRITEDLQPQVSRKMAKDIMNSVPDRRSFLKNLGGALAAPLSAAASRPNVLFIISDQFHHASYGAAGNPVVKTPNLDRLAHEGVRFEHAVCATPFCSPTRASFLTGLYPHKHGITYNVDGRKAGLDPKLPSTEQTLFENG